MHLNYRSNAKAFHGGASFEFIGPRFDDLSKIKKCINADVLDAWFDPAPSVISKLKDHLIWALRTSPPTHCEGLLQVLSEDLGVEVDNLLVGAGSSNLIFLSMQKLIDEKSSALTLDPTYGEYHHIFDQVIGCHCFRVPFEYDTRGAYGLDTERVISEIRNSRPNLVVLVNPNSPTGTCLSYSELVKIHQSMPQETILWIDETYIDYVDGATSLVKYAAGNSNVIVCKSLSKIYALSGVRSAYLCSSPKMIEFLRQFSPPWAVSLPAQLATIAAVQDKPYYSEKYAETRRYREGLASSLRSVGLKVHDAVANFMIAELPLEAGGASKFVQACRYHGLYLRDISSMGTNVHSSMVRIAVKSETTNQQIVATIKDVISSATRDSSSSLNDWTDERTIQA